MQQLLMRRPNLADLPEIPPLLAGYTLRTGREADLQKLAVLLQRAFADESWTPAKVHEALVADTSVKTTYVVEFAGTLVATASVRLLPEAYPDSGYLHWVAADPHHRGKGLGYIVTLAVMQEFARSGCKDTVLETDDQRIPAIKTYLKLGYLPVYRDESHQDRWTKIEAVLRDE